uniref:ANK_REP_REGION domain-containing protein n=1 Tax=Syphacia muris TaxID=451379 RepID=A0A0N5AR09_9BILA
MSSGDTACLMARAASNTGTLKPQSTGNDDVVAKLEALCIKEKSEKLKDDKEKLKKKHAFVDNVSPVDFLNYQNAKSSFLARKMKTAAKLHRVGPELFAELLQHPGKKNRKEEDENATKEGKNEHLNNDNDKSKSGFIARGPSRIERTPISHHPYGDGKGQSYGTAPKRTDAKHPYQHAYENNYAWTDSPETVGYNSNNSSPGTYQTDMGYFSSSPQQQQSSFPQCPLSELDRYLDGENEAAKETSHEEVPKIVSDFILTYSRPYSASTSEESANVRDTEKHSRNSSFSESSDKARRHSTDSGCDSPMSAGSAPHCSPNAPRGTSSGLTCYNENGNYINDPDGSLKELRKRAKERFRDIFTEKEYDEGQLWAIRVYKELSNRNHCLDQKQYDGDTLLHIVTSNRDYGKIYALSELLLKNDMVCSSNPIDVRNDQNETPLFKAVEYRCRPEAIEYFLALGADPNVQPMQNGKPIKDPPLHYAASHSMPEIVQVLCKKADINMVNGYGYTPLLCAALKHNHLICKETGLRLDNSETIRILLAHGANPQIYDRKCQRSLLNEVYEKMEPELSEILKAYLDERVYYDMTNQELTNDQRYYQESQDNVYPNQGYGYVDYAEQPYTYN